MVRKRPCKHIRKINGKTILVNKHVPPIAAQRNARRALEFKRKYPKEVKAMTDVGWTRARQLSSGKPLSTDIVKRMARFERHRKNAVIEPQHKSKPWRDRGYVAWLGWGGNEGVDWAKRVSKRCK